MDHSSWPPTTNLHTGHLRCILDIAAKCEPLDDFSLSPFASQCESVLLKTHAKMLSIPSVLFKQLSWPTSLKFLDLSCGTAFDDNSLSSFPTMMSVELFGKKPAVSPSNGIKSSNEVFAHLLCTVCEDIVPHSSIQSIRMINIDLGAGYPVEKNALRRTAAPLSSRDHIQ
ncbi:hypothetical protein GYMLUDRAFT_235950 [Collybiopsis luxurians FD-317 M1]|nr:hypothetical protein GYMLUDRAFT_235950 [Collybiopsis luxurians FD-317 M1]